MSLSPSIESGLPRLPRVGVGVSRAEWGIVAAAVGLAAVVAWLCAAYPAALPVWAPWEFSWSQFLTAELALAWYARGVWLLPAGERPGVFRQASFLLGLAAIYGVLLTHFEYVAQHMFFLNRLQHMAMHHLGPFLVALSWPGPALWRGMPDPLRRIFGSRAVGRAMRVVQFPPLAGLLFVGLIYFWLIPAVHFRAMIDPGLYGFMNWTMVVDGLLFWSLVLDPRPAPPAYCSYATRLIVTILVMFPQIILGAWITFNTSSLYAYYDLCGRLIPSIGALADQHIGGVILWIPSSMMSSAAFMLTLNNIRRHEDKAGPPIDDPAAARMAEMSRQWTGR